MLKLVGIYMETQRLLKDASLGNSSGEFIGDPFTWRREMESRVTIKHLDQCVANEEWLETFPRAKVLHLDLWCSDHRVFLLVPGRSNWSRRGARRLYFRKAQSHNKDCEDIIEDCWGMDYTMAVEKCGRVLPLREGRSSTLWRPIWRSTRRP